MLFRIERDFFVFGRFLIFIETVLLVYKVER